jgi:hypothetical protein
MKQMAVKVFHRWRRTALVLSLLATGAEAKNLNPTAHEISDSPMCRAGAIRCVDGVIREMKRRVGSLARSCDHDAVFALTYLRTTEVFRDTALTLGYDNVSSVVREDALFADYYFRAYDAYRAGPLDSGQSGAPPAWRIAFDAAKARRMPAQGNAFLGISAHIQRDLPFVLYDLYAQGHPVSYEDHTLVNEFLAQVDVAPEIIARFDPTYPAGGDISLIVAWREAAFQNFERLRDASDAERVVIGAEIDYAAALAAAAIVDSLAYPEGEDSSERDAFCEAHN